MLPKRITFPSARPAANSFPHTLFRTLCRSQKLNSFAINQVQTLSARHPGWGVLRTKRQRNSLLISSPAPRSLRYHCHRFACPLFSEGYKTLLAQPFSFHIYTKPRGWRRAHTKSSRRSTFNYRLWTSPIPRGRAAGNTAYPSPGLAGGVTAAANPRCVLRSRFRRY